jgi:hypothetical protein
MKHTLQQGLAERAWKMKLMMTQKKRKMILNMLNDGDFDGDAWNDGEVEETQHR